MAKKAEKDPAWQFIMSSLRKKKSSRIELEKLGGKSGYTVDEIRHGIQEARDRAYVLVYSFVSRTYTLKPNIGELFTWLRSRRRHAFTSLRRAKSAYDNAKRVPAARIPQKLKEPWKILMSSMGDEIRLLAQHGAI